MTRALDSWIEAAESAWSRDLVGAAPHIHQHLVPTTSHEGEAIASFLEDPAALSLAEVNQVWSNVAEGLDGFIEFDTSDRRKSDFRLVFYVCCGLAGLFVIGGTQLTDEDSAAAAMIGALWASARAGNRSWDRSLELALKEWPGSFCHESRNALVTIISRILTNNTYTSTRLISHQEEDALLRGLDAFDRPLDSVRSMVQGLRFE
jgi:hypothetical protein